MSNQALANNETLLGLKKSLPKTTAPEIQYKPVVEGDTYMTVRYKVEKRVVVHEVKKNKILLKRDKDAKDSFSISRAEFDKYYFKVE